MTPHENLGRDIVELALSDPIYFCGSGELEHAILASLQTVVEVEREACANVAAEHSKNCAACGCDGWQIAGAIRARGDK